MKIEIQGAVILKDGEQIATAEGSTVTSLAKLAPTVKGAIKKALGDDAVTFAEATQVGSEKTSPTTNSQMLSDADLLALLAARGLAPQVAPRPSGQLIEIENRFLSKQQILERFAQIEPPPPTLDDMGDKTPAYVEWVRRHATEDEWNKIYGTRIQRKGKLPTLEDRDRGEQRRRAMLDRLPTETTGKKGDNE